jgi:hypothetical protein
MTRERQGLQVTGIENVRVCRTKAAACASRCALPDPEGESAPTRTSKQNSQRHLCGIDQSFRGAHHQRKNTANYLATTDVTNTIAAT